MLEKREHWSNSLGFIFAAAGSAIGLGNIWKFPYIAGENGGGAFVLVYLACIVLVGMPVMLCEMTLGRATQKSPVGAFKALSPKNSHTANLLGVCLIFAGLALLCFKQFGWSAVICLSGIILIYFHIKRKK
jgi:NSS family neurotransmitter:Na+ symporter